MFIDMEQFGLKLIPTAATVVFLLLALVLEAVALQGFSTKGKALSLDLVQIIITQCLRSPAPSPTGGGAGPAGRYVE